jgi:hypothetical protein
MPMDRAAKLETFLEGGLWLSRIDTFGPIKLTKEGELPRRNIGLLEKMPSFMVEWVERQYELAVLRSYASCWSKGDHTPSEDLWDSSFGGNGNGIAICTTPEEISAATDAITSKDGNGPVYFGSVDYIDHSTHQIPEGNTLYAAFAIKSGYSAENEARVLIHSYGANAVKYLLYTAGLYGPLVMHLSSAQSSSGEREFSGGHQDGKAIVIKINKQQFIHKIVFGKSVNPEDRNRVTKLIAKYGLESKITD